MPLEKKASNFGVRTELGSFPLFIKARCLLFKYWLRLLTLPNNSLLRAAYDPDCDSIGKKSSNFRNCWAASVKRMLFSYGLGYIWEQQAQIRPNSQNSKCYISIFKQRLHDKYLQVARSAIENNKKLEENTLLIL